MTGLKNYKWLIISYILLIGLASMARGSSGQYLIASDAIRNSDYTVVAENFSSMIKKGESDPSILQDALIFSVLSNNFEIALQIAKKTDAMQLTFPSASIILLVDLVRSGEYEKVEQFVNKHSSHIPEIIRVFSIGWSEIAVGNFDVGLVEFSKFRDKMSSLYYYHSAIAFALNNDFSIAANQLDKIPERGPIFGNTDFFAQAQIYSMNGEVEKAKTILAKSQFKNDDLRYQNAVAALNGNQKVQFDTFSTPNDVIASILALVGQIGMENSGSSLSTMFYLRLAENLSINKASYSIKLAESFGQNNVNDLVVKSFESVVRTSPLYLKAQLGLASAFIDRGRTNEAISLLDDLIDNGFNVFVVHDKMGDALRISEQYDLSIKYYTEAIKNFNSIDKIGLWSTFFFRGISHDQSGNWDSASIDLRKALELRPAQPQVLNYLGYSLIERKQNLDEALFMIEQAVKQEPDSGYIVDSLGWCFFRLGRFNEAIGPMERAVQLEPFDPIVNDHLGDVLWMVGRQREARFQWQRSLSLEPEVEEVEKILKKLEFGLDN